MSVAMMLVGITNFTTGILPVFKFKADATWSSYSDMVDLIPAPHAGELLSLFLGIILFSLGIGLYQRKFSAWIWSYIFLVLALINSVYGHFQVQTFTASLAYMLLLVLFRKNFRQRNHQRLPYSQIIAWVSILTAISYGTIGSYLLRDEFNGIHNWFDAVYFTLVTYSTVGYGDITPITTNAKVFVASMIIIGVSSFVATLSLVFGPMIENRVKGVLHMMTKLRNLKDHIVICGYNPMSLYAAIQLLEQGQVCLFILKNNDLQPELESRGFITLVGDATTKETLLNARVNNAKTLISAFESDADNILTVMTAEAIRREQSTRLPKRIITRIDQKQNIDKAKAVGADEVISPAILGGDLMANEALSGS